MLKFIFNTFIASLCLCLLFENQSYASGDAEGSAVQEVQQEDSYAVFKNPRRHRTSSSVYAIRIDGRRVRLGQDFILDPGVHSMDLVFNGQREAFEVQVEVDFEAGVTYLPKYKRVDRKGLEHIVVRVVNAETKKVVGKARPYLPRYSRRAVNPQHR